MRDTLKVTTAGKGGVVRCTLSKETQSVLEILWRSAGRTRSDGLTRFAPQTIPPSDALCEAALPNPTIATNRLGMKFYKHPAPSMSVMGQERTLAALDFMSALPPITDIAPERVEIAQAASGI